MQGLVALIVTYLPQFFDMWLLPEWLSLALVLVVMAVLAPLMAKLGERTALLSFSECVVCDAEGNIVSLEQALEERPEVGVSESTGDTDD